MDLPEHDIIHLLHMVIKNQQDSDSSSMNINSEASDSKAIPKVADFLALCVRYPTTTQTLRVAMRQHLREAEEVTTLLEILCLWIESHATANQLLFPEKGSSLRVLPTQDHVDLPPLARVR